MYYLSNFFFLVMKRAGHFTHGQVLTGYNFY